MASNTSLTPLSEDDYAAIEAAVMETGRGRWFLAEYAKRNRTADTNTLLAALERLEGAIGRGGGGQQAVERVRSDLVEMASMIARLKLDVASDNPAGTGLEQASEVLDGVVSATENATSTILESAEHVQEIAWRLREQGADAASCDALDQRAAQIYTSCGFQDVTAQSTRKVMRTLRALEGRINALVDAWDQSAPAGSAAAMPALIEDGDPSEGSGYRRHLYVPVPVPSPILTQDDIDVVIVGEETLEIDPDTMDVAQRRPEFLPADAQCEVSDLVFIEDELAPPPTEGEALLEAPSMPQPEPAEASAPLPAAEPEPEPEPALPAPPRAVQPLAGIDRLSTLDKLGMFS